MTPFRACASFAAAILYAAILHATLLLRRSRGMALQTTPLGKLGSPSPMLCHSWMAVT